MTRICLATLVISFAAWADPAPSKPTIVLVHWAWADGSSWSAVARGLQHAGYTVEVPPNPLRSLASDSAYLGAFLSSIDGPVVLAGHSYGGAVITNAANGKANVKALVYVDAYIPDEGDTLFSMTGARPGSLFAADPTTLFKFVPYPGAPQRDFDLYVKPDVFPRAFTGDMPAKMAATLAASQRPLTLGALNEKSGPPAWKAIPAWVLIGTEDQIIPPAEQRALAASAKAHVTEVKAPHLSMITAPEAVAKLILEAAQSAQ